MTLKEAENFLKSVHLQQELNRSRHQNTEADDRRQPVDWVLIAGEHFGQLMGAARKNDKEKTLTEILHVTAVLMECWESLHRETIEKKTYICNTCNETYALSETTGKCPLCQGPLIQG